MVVVKQSFPLLAFAGLLGLSTPGQAQTILASCTEDISCIFQGTVTVDTTAGNFNSSYSRLALRPAASTAVTPPANRVETKTFSAASSDFWVSANYNTSSNTTVNNVTTVFFADAGVTRLALRGTGTNQQLKLTTRNAAGTLVDLATATGSLCALSTRCKLDIHVVYAVAGSVNVYNNGLLILTYTGDVTTNSATTLNSVGFGGTSTAVATFAWSQMFASNSDTRSMVSVTCVPSASGATQSWTGSAANVNPNSYSDATFNYTVANDALSQWKSGCSIPTSGTTTVVDVRSFGRLAKGTGGPQNARFSTNVGGTDYDNGSDLSGMTTSFQNFEYDWGINSPATATPWTPTELNGIFTTGGFGVKSRP
jgi:hypothetical protein